ncbi:hypothetical protein A2U01_0116876, partial [Trifolium medium]|nr:hypothetical protein [Trifolium medium]
MGKMVVVRVEDGAVEGVYCGEARIGVVVGSIIFMVEECN